MGLDNSLSTYNSTFLRGLRFDCDKTTDSSECSPLGQLFVYASREIHYPRLIELLNGIKDSEPKTIFDMMLYIRSPRGGRGSRLVGRFCFQWFLLHFPSYLQEHIELLPEHGRWDDLFWLFPGAMKLEDRDYVCRNFVCDVSSEMLNEAVKAQNYIVEFVCNSLLRDFRTYSKGGIPSLLVKWLPSERSALDNKFGICSTIISQLKISPHDYRVIYLSPMREALGITERSMCRGDWEAIDISKVPKGCLSKNRIAFRRHLGHKKDKFVSSEPEILVEKCIDQLLKYGSRRNKITTDYTVEAAWLRIAGIVSLHSQARSKVVIDTDGTMYTSQGKTRIISKTIAAALLISHVSASKDPNLGIFSFTKNNGFVKLPQGTDLTLLELTNLLRLTFTAKPKIADLVKLAKQDDSKSSLIYISSSDPEKGDYVLKKPLEKRIIIWNICSNIFTYEEKNNIVKIRGYRDDIIRYLICFGNFDPSVSIASDWR